MGNPGNGGAGLVCGDFEAKVVGVMAQGLGQVTNYEAECHAVALAMEVATNNNWSTIWIESDSKTVVQGSTRRMCLGSTEEDGIKLALMV
ncbi:hypothetical protein IFM89_011941 [Coptis chinensis]|uniref:RNase H type-1 domain-containing protein n=1 Tax=Coptis chinensis TaxID=261450 RepID=A0A835LE22_9MAGN|nr:hypothetical protein IFM89_011941 [Coptis chinensis]